MFDIAYCGLARYTAQFLVIAMRTRHRQESNLEILAESSLPVYKLKTAGVPLSHGGISDNKVSDSDLFKFN